LTVGLLCVLPLGRRILAPGVDAYEVAEQEVPAGLVSVFALGVMPMISAYIAVEVLALTRPKWRALRHAWPDGRAKLERAASTLAILLAAFQAFGAAKF